MLIMMSITIIIMIEKVIIKNNDDDDDDDNDKLQGTPCCPDDLFWKLSILILINSLTLTPKVCNAQKMKTTFEHSFVFESKWLNHYTKINILSEMGLCFVCSAQLPCFILIELFVSDHILILGNTVDNLDRVLS